MSDNPPPDRLNQLLDRLQEIYEEHKEFFEQARRRQEARPKPRKETAADFVQPSFWWSGALAPHPEFAPQTEAQCRQIEFNASSIHRLASFARVRYRVPERKAGVMLVVTITDCPLAGTHCDGDPDRCLLRVAGNYGAVTWKHQSRGLAVGIN